MQHLTGKPFDLEAVAGVPLFVYLGDADTNDSVTYADSFDPGARKIVFDNFGATLQARWRYTEALYGKYLPRATLRLFPNVGHSSKAMYPGVAAFFAKVLGK